MSVGMICMLFLIYFFSNVLVDGRDALPNEATRVCPEHSILPYKRSRNHIICACNFTLQACSSINAMRTLCSTIKYIAAEDALIPQSFA